MPAAAKVKEYAAPGARVPESKIALSETRRCAVPVLPYPPLVRSPLTHLTVARVAKLSLKGLGEKAPLPRLLASRRMATSPLGRQGSFSCTPRRQGW